MSLEKYIPSEDLVKKAADAVDPRILTHPNGPSIRELQNELKKVFYGTVNMLCFRNLAFENGEDSLRKKYAQVPENPKLSIVSDSREEFNSEILKILEDCLIVRKPRDFLREWSQEFYDYVSQQGGFEIKLGNFYLDSGKVYFETKKSLPPKPKTGQSIVVGGIAID